MADISPFISTPGQWIEELAQIRAQRNKLEDRENHIKTKLREHLDREKLTELSGETHYARIEVRESTDFSQKTLAEVFGPKWLASTKKKLPTKTTEALVIREIPKADVPEKLQSTKTDQIAEFFGAKETYNEKEKKPWQK